MSKVITTFTALVMVVVLTACRSDPADQSATDLPTYTYVAPPDDGTVAPAPADTTVASPSSTRVRAETCADWSAASSDKRARLTKRFVARFAPDLKLPGGTAGYLDEAITSTCNLTPATEDPPLDVVARLSLNFLRKNRLDVP